MKIKFIFLLSFILIGSVNASAQVKKANILSIYLKLPNTLIEWVDPDGKEFNKQRRLEVIKKKDIKNGYMELNEDDGSSGFELALFNSKTGPMVAIVKEGMSVQNYKIVQEVNGNWTDITKEVFPDLSKELMIEKHLKSPAVASKVTRERLLQYAGSIHKLILPRKGTVIKVASGFDMEGVYNVPLFDIAFDGEKFLIKE